MHGIGASASDMDTLVGWLTSSFPGIYVKNVEIGNGVHDSMWMNMDLQVASFCAQVEADPQLQNGFNLLGYSQGSLITRAYVERCDTKGLVHNFITLGGPHEGVFGVPNLYFLIPQALLDLITAEIYSDFVQKNTSWAGYWKDPFRLKEYSKSVKFLPDINNEGPAKNPLYRERIARLNNLVLVTSDHDYVIIPRQSNYFEYYKPDNLLLIQELKTAQWYIEDWIGLKSLDEAGRLHFLRANCTHETYPDVQDRAFFMESLLPFFNNTVQ